MIVCQEEMEPGRPEPAPERVAAPVIAARAITRPSRRAGAAGKASEEVVVKAREEAAAADREVAVKAVGDAAINSRLSADELTDVTGKLINNHKKEVL